MESNLPATTEEPALPATPPAAPATPGGAERPGPRQNVMTGLVPIALGILVLLFVGLAFWTLMSVTGGGG